MQDCIFNYCRRQIEVWMYAEHESKDRRKWGAFLLTTGKCGYRKLKKIKIAVVSQGPLSTLNVLMLW